MAAKPSGVTPLADAPGCEMRPLASILETLRQDHGVIPVLAAEIEWYVFPATEVTAPALYVQQFLQRLTEQAKSAGLRLHSVSQERGPLQMEAALLPSSDIVQLIADYASLHSLIQAEAVSANAEANFAAKPHADTYGSGLHVHLHLENADGARLFHKEGERLSAALRHTLGGLLVRMPLDLPIFAPHTGSWQRFTPGFNAPVNASWGTNNRTVALRLPDQTGLYQGTQLIANAIPTTARRIEHRVAGADADFPSVVAAILEGVVLGLTEAIEPSPPIYGNAADAQYGLERFGKQ